jgi:cell division protein FtsQ
MSFAALQTAQVRRAKAEEGKRSSRAILDAIWRAAAAAVLSAAVGAGGFYGYRWASNAAVFSIREIHVSGAAHATEAELIARSGLKVGGNLFRADLLEAARGVEVHPWVASARLTRKLPGTIEIAVTEHRPAALVQMGALYVLDEEGRLFKRASPGDRLDLPIVSGLSRNEPQRELRLFHALHFLDTWRAAGFAVSDLSELRLEDDGAVTLFARDGDAVQEVRVGASDWPLALRRLSSMRGALARRGEHATKINLDNPARPSEAAATLAEKR